MRVGVLMCAHIDEDLQPEIGGDYDVLYGDFVALAGDSVEAVGYDVIGGELPSSPDECDLWVITGSPADSFSEEQWVEDLRAFVRSIHEHRANLLGICFGHQIVTEALGGKVERAGKWKVGSSVVHLDATEWWEGGDVVIPAFHQDVVVEVPPGAEVIGSSSEVPVGAMRMGDHILTIQNHPEFGTRYFMELLDRRGDGLPPKVLMDARRRTSEMPHDAPVLSAWVRSFFSGGNAPDA